MLEDEREQIAKENLNLIWYMINKKYKYGDIEEKFEYGLIGLTKGINSYDKSKNSKLSTYLCKCIDNELKMYLRKNSRNKIQQISLYSDVDSDGIRLIDTLGIDYEFDNELITKEIMGKIVERVSMLPEHWQKAFYHTYGINGYKELTQCEIANMIGVQQAQVSRINSKIIRMLKYYLREYF